VGGFQELRDPVVRLLGHIERGAAQSSRSGACANLRHQPQRVTKREGERISSEAVPHADQHLSPPAQRSNCPPSTRDGISRAHVRTSHSGHVASVARISTDGGGPTNERDPARTRNGRRFRHSACADGQLVQQAELEGARAAARRPRGLWLVLVALIGGVGTFAVWLGLGKSVTGALEPFGFTLRPEIAAISMSGSSVPVATSAMALKRLRLGRG
jgi:hypothetical protein